jgi:hypothetical protein
MTKKLLFIGAIALFAMACGGNTATVNTNTNAPVNVTNTTTNTTTNATVNAPTNVANTTNTTNTANPNNVANANKSANTTAAKPAQNTPKRVSFAAGKSEGKESLSLTAGESKQFVVGAKSGQIFMVDTDSKDIEITMIKGKDSAQMKEPGHYDSTLIADGDFVFQVKNTSKKEVKTSMNVIISNTGISNR